MARATSARARSKWSIDPATGNYAAIPFDGWIQALWYRADVFKSAGLAAPVTWDQITAACEVLPGNDNLLYGMTLGTDPGQNYPHQVFEQVAISNDAWPFDAAGNVTMDTPEMVAALQWYTEPAELLAARATVLARRPRGVRIRPVGDAVLLDLHHG